MKAQFFLLLKNTLKKNHIYINWEELKLQLLSHPSYPSLHALTGVLDHFNIPNAALRLPCNLEILEDLPTDFLAVLEYEDQEQLYQIKRLKEGIQLQSEGEKTTTITKSKFLQLWTGVVLLVEKEEHSFQKKGTLNSVLTYTGIALLSILLLYQIQVSFPFYAYTIGHFLLSLLGIVFSIYILREELGLTSTFQQKVCAQGKTTSCKTVLNSKGATVFKILKLSDIALFTFGSFSLIWILSSILNIDTSTLVFSASSVGTLVIIYSIYYQGVILKKWCTLCLGIVSVLTLQAIISISFFVEHGFKAIPINAIVLTTSSVLTTILISNLIKRIWTQLKHLNEKEVQYLKLKKNFTVFKSLLTNEQKVQDDSLIEDEIVLGNKNAPVILTLVTNPFCSYCSSALEDIEQLYLKAENHLQIRIRFATKFEDKQSMVYQLVITALELYHTKGQLASLAFLKRAHSKNKRELIDNLKNGLQKNTNYDLVIKKQYDWCQKNNIHFTPAFFLNGYKFPAAYERTDVITFIEDLTVENTNSLKKMAS